MTQQAVFSGKTGLKSIPGKTDRLHEVLEKGLQIPWMGIRPDIVLHKGALRADDKESYILEDPVRGAHFELGEAEARFFLCLVTEADLKSAIDKLLKTTSLRPSAENILSFVRMLQQEKLAILPPEIALATAEKRTQAKKAAGFAKLFTGYLFFKVPLLRPEPLLNAIYPWLRPLWSKPLLFLYAVLGVVGLVLVSQQMELYFHTANYLFTPKGAAAFLFCLVVLKLMHEFGHALTAKHHGLFVRRMGVAFMVFIPMLFTDTTEAWKLPSRKGRLYIGAAGILVELTVAGLALFFWAILPDGTLRSLMFYMSGASVFSTIMVNLNPLMRFDGYYLLMDFMRISNLRSRSLAMFKYYRHRLWVDWQGPKPEEHPDERFLALFGLVTLIYRVMIFLSIGFAIYYKVFKALGVLLLLMQFVLMIVFPLMTEAVYLIRQRKYWGAKTRVLTTAAVSCILLAVLFVPFPRFEMLPGLVLFQDMTRLEAPGAGRMIADLPEIGTRVQAGDLLLTIRNDGMEQEMEKLRYDLHQAETTIRYMGSSGSQGGYRKWMLAERERLTAEMEKIRQALAQMEIRAPISGRIMEVNESLGKDSYVRKKSHLLTLAPDRAYEIRGYAREDIYREIRGKEIREGKVVFQDMETPSVQVSFRKMLDFPVSEFPNESLFDYAGGEIASLFSDSREIRSRLAYYPMIFDSPELPAYLRHGTRCFVRVRETESHSLAQRSARTVWRFLAVEGFI